MASTTCEVILELARSENIESPLSFRFAPQDYLLRHEDGRYRRSSFPWDAKVLGALAELERPEPDAGAVQRLGETLRAFLTPLDWRLYEDRIDRALKAGQQVRLTLRFAAAELYSLPWELVTLESTGQHLGELEGCTLRYEWPGAQGEAAARPPAPPGGGRLLFAWSSAGGPVPVAQHLRALLEACRRRGFPFDAVADVVENVSAQSLAQALAVRPGEPVSVLHLLCHGARKGDEAAGLLWNPSGGSAPDVVDAGRLRQMLAPYAGTLRMVVLCSCQSGDSRPGNYLGSVAQALHRAGIPAVVASRLPMSTKASVLVAETLHAELMRAPSSSIERALAATRSRLRQEMPGLDWASLQLYATDEGARLDVYGGTEAPAPLVALDWRPAAVAAVKEQLDVFALELQLGPNGLEVSARDALASSSPLPRASAAPRARKVAPWALAAIAVLLLVGLAAGRLLGSRPAIGGPPATQPTPAAPAADTLRAPREGPIRVAVLPFKNLTGQQDLDVLREAMAEAVVTDFGSTEGVVLIERGQIDADIGELEFQAGKYVDPATRAQIGKIHGAELVVVGSVQKFGATLRAVARLVDAETGEVLPGAIKVERPADQLLDLQDALGPEVSLAVKAARPRLRK